MAFGFRPVSCQFHGQFQGFGRVWEPRYEIGHETSMKPSFLMNPGIVGLGIVRPFLLRAWLLVVYQLHGLFQGFVRFGGPGNESGHGLA